MSTLAKMSPKIPKLVVHKIGLGNCETLETNIGDCANNSKGRQSISRWTHKVGKRHRKAKESFSRGMIVGIASGDEVHTLDLDSCANKIEDAISTSTITTGSIQIGKVQTKQHSKVLAIPFNNIQERGELEKFYTIKELQPTCQQDTVDSATLEHSLEKVRENNARIMENIRMLNRTLDYTKKKEILEVSGNKSMFPCLICEKCFVYETGLKKHYAMRHASCDAPPRWQVVWTCTECYQVWPEQDLAVAHARMCTHAEDTEIVREIKTSLLLQCEFCDKVYTSIPRLLKHSKLHTTAKNYECNACQSTLKCYKTAELHWMLCPWLKIYYTFSLPKMWLCHICDRKFKNYEQLYNHRYKVGHYISKLNLATDNAMPLVSFQCELCAQWFHTVSQLEEHRRTKHPAHDSASHTRNATSTNYRYIAHVPHNNHHVKIESDNTVYSYTVRL